MKNFLRLTVNLVFYIFLSLLFAIYLLFYLNLEKEQQNLQKKIELAVFLKNDFSAENTAHLAEKLRQEAEINEVVYTSREDALKEFQKDSEISKIVTLLKENPLPASFTIYPREYSSETIRKLSEKISSLEGIEKTIYDQKLLEKYEFIDFLSRTTKAINFVFLGLFFLLLLFLLIYFFFFLEIKPTLLSFFQQSLFALLGSGMSLGLFYFLLGLVKTSLVYFNSAQVIFLIGATVVFSLVFNLFLTTGSGK